MFLFEKKASVEYILKYVVRIYEKTKKQLFLWFNDQ